jgi:membrane-bound lytic murein transglycosylase F
MSPPQLSERPARARPPFRAAAAAAAALFAGTCSQPPALLEQVRSKGVLTVVTRNSPTAYYNGVEGPDGPEYELAVGFAQLLGVELELKVASSGAAALDEVRHNRAQLAAAGIVATEARRSRVAFGPVYQRIGQHVVYHARRPLPASPSDLVGARIEVIAGSTHAAALAALAAEVPGLAYTEVQGVDQLDLLARVSSGAIDCTVADSTDFSIGRHFHPELRLAFELANSQAIAWALNPHDRSLDPWVQRYFEALEASGELAKLLARHYAAADHFDYLDSVSFVRHVHERLPDLRPFF